MGIILLIIALSIVTVGNYYLNNRDYLSPGTIFSFMFLLSAVDCAIYLPKWDTSISVDTALTIFAGVLSFSLSALCIRALDRRKKRAITMEEERRITVKIYITKVQLVIFLLFQSFISVMVLRQVLALTAPYLDSAGISNAISTYQHLAKNTTLNLRFSTWLIYSSLVTSSSGFFFGYVIAHNLFYKHKNGILLYANFAISAAGGLLTGSRGNSLQMILTTAFILLFFYKSKGKGTLLKGKTLAKIAIAGVVLLIAFQWTAGLMGRSKGDSFGDYISVYLGAPMKNMDLFLTKQVDASKGHSETFLMQMNWWDSHFGNGAQYAINTQFNYVNGHNLGNVYSCFKSFYADFGMVGVILLSILMGIIIQLLHENIHRLFTEYTANGKITIIVIYSYLLFSVMFCFFSNKFYESFTITFVERMLVVYGFSIVYLNRKSIFRRKKSINVKRAIKTY